VSRVRDFHIQGYPPGWRQALPPKRSGSRPGLGRACVRREGAEISTERAWQPLQAAPRGSARGFLLRTRKREPRKQGTTTLVPPAASGKGSPLDDLFERGTRYSSSVLASAAAGQPKDRRFLRTAA